MLVATESGIVVTETGIVVGATNTTSVFPVSIETSRASMPTSCVLETPTRATNEATMATGKRRRIAVNSRRLLHHMPIAPLRAGASTNW